MTKIRSTLATIFETYTEKSTFVAKTTLLGFVKMLDRSSIMDKEICEMIMDEIPKMNELEPMNA